MIGKITNGFSFGQIGGSKLDVSGNYTCIDGVVSHFLCTCANTQDWWWLDEALTKKNDGSDIPADRLADIETDLKWLGRTYVADDRHYFNWTNSGFDLNINGTGATALLTSSCPASNQTYLKIYVDGVNTQTVQMTAPVMTVTLAENLTDGPHNIKVIKRTNGRSSTAALKKLWVDEGTEILAPNKAATRKIQFLGDSITVGYGSMDWLKPSAWSTDSEDGTITYAALATKYFGADNHTVAISGRGVIWNTGGNKDTANHAPLMYEYTDWNNHAQWDHTLYQPDVVVINLGTNDKASCVTANDQATFKTAVYNLIKQVRKDNPNAHIIWAFGAMGDGNNVAANIQAAIAQLKTEGETKLSYVGMGTGTTCLGHPTSAAHEDRAEELIAEIKAVTGWTEHTACSYDKTVLTAASCKNDGLAGYTCKICGDYYEEVIPADDHVADDELVVDTAPACGVAGIGHSVCEVCGATIEEGLAIPATGEHVAAEDLVVDTAPTCGANGVGHSVCGTCGITMETGLAIPATGNHTWDNGVVTTEPTANTEGVKTFTCTVCGETKTEQIPATGVDVLTVFKDLKKKDWYVKNGAIDYVYNNGLFTGTTTTTFGPNENMTRAM
ncbi:MAG: S-layer homology domain-containing protein, partial [Clostridia bacterium]|nr:S-layer homology domain-containing protein [Clostridia bacterium]